MSVTKEDIRTMPELDPASRSRIYSKALNKIADGQESLCCPALKQAAREEDEEFDELEIWPYHILFPEFMDQRPEKVIRENLWWKHNDYRSRIEALQRANRNAVKEALMSPVVRRHVYKEAQKIYTGPESIQAVIRPAAWRVFGLDLNNVPTEEITNHLFPELRGYLGNSTFSVLEEASNMAKKDFDTFWKEVNVRFGEIHPGGGVPDKPEFPKAKAEVMRAAATQVLDEYRRGGLENTPNPSEAVRQVGESITGYMFSSVGTNVVGASSNTEVAKWVNELMESAKKAEEG